MKILSKFISPTLPCFMIHNNGRIARIFSKNIVSYNEFDRDSVTKIDRDVPKHVDLTICAEWNKEDDDIKTIKDGLLKGMSVIDNFISEEEEQRLFGEVEPILKKMRYEFDHWDDAIHGFRETERTNWNDFNSEIIKKARTIALPDLSDALPHIHVLDLDAKGYIKPHVDAIRFCGSTVAGICLLSPAVMRLRHSKSADLFADFLLSRRCFYIMSGAARYDFSHEILENKLSYFNQQLVERTRRISLITRNRPKSS